MEERSTIYDDDDFIDMKLCFSSSSPLPKHRNRFSRDDFEFQIMSSSLINTFHDRFADELFHRGKLLPLLTQEISFPPSRADHETTTFHHAIPSILAANTETVVDEDYCFFEWSNDDVTHHRQQQQRAEKRSANWSKRLYHQTLNASKKYLRSLFSNHRKLLLSDKKDDGVIVESHRSSFSFSGTVFSSSSSSSSSSSTPTMPRSSLSTLIINELDTAASCKKLKKRSCSSARFEFENSIEGAIDYCKRSHDL